MICTVLINSIVLIARCKQSSGESFLTIIDSLLWLICDTNDANPFDGWMIDEWLARWLNQWARRVSPAFWGPQFAAGIHIMEQFSHNRYLPRCQCTEACSHVSSIQNNNLWFTTWVCNLVMKNQIKNDIYWGHKSLTVCKSPLLMVDNFSMLSLILIWINVLNSIQY